MMPHPWIIPVNFLIKVSPQKSNIDTKKWPYLKPGFPPFPSGPSFWGPPAVSFRGCKVQLSPSQLTQTYPSRKVLKAFFWHQTHPEVLEGCYGGFISYIIMHQRVMSMYKFQY